MRWLFSVLSPLALTVLLALSSSTLSQAAEHSCGVRLSNHDSKRVLMLPESGTLAHVSRLLEIGRELRARGHSVSFGGDPHGKYMHLVESAGLPILPMSALSQDRIQQVERKAGVDYYDFEYLRDSVAEEIALFRRLNVDLVVSDFRNSVNVSARAAGVRHAVVLGSTWTHFSDGIEEVTEQFPTRRLAIGFGKHLGLPGQWLIRAATAASNAVLPTIKSIVLKQGNRPFNRVARLHGLPETEDLFETWRQADLVLIADLPSVGRLQEGHPSNFRHIGPLTWSGETRPSLMLEDFDRRHVARKTVLYFSMGSTGNPRYLELAFELFAEHPDYEVLMTTGGLIEIPDVLPQNFFVAKFAPGSEVLARADVFISQGGSGSMYQAIGAGVPMLLIPYMHDQNWNALRVERLGLGRRLSDLQFSKEDFLTALDEILANLPQYRSRFAPYQDESRSTDGPATAADAIEELMRKP